MSKKRVIWSDRAKQSLKFHHDRIKVDSEGAAKRVKEEIINSSKTLAKYPDKYQLDEHYPNNPGNIRRYFRWSYRVVYQVDETTISILNVLHTSQEPNTV